MSETATVVVKGPYPLKELATLLASLAEVYPTVQIHTNSAYYRRQRTAYVRAEEGQFHIYFTEEEA